MTNEERDKTIAQIERIQHHLASVGETVDYLDFAIEALEAQPTDKCKGCYYNDGEAHAECVVCDKGTQPTDMTIDEAIKHCEEVAEELRKQASIGLDSMDDTIRVERCRECANEHRQLAEWLKELKAWRTFGLRVGEIISLYLPDDMVAKLLKTLDERSGGAE